MLGVGIGLTSVSALSQNRLRLIPTFAGSQYGTLNTPITFTGDFEVEVVAVTTVSAGTAIALFGKQDATVDYVQLQNSASNITLTTADGTVSVAKTDHLDGKVHTYKFKRVGLTLSIDVDGVEVDSSLKTGAATVVIGLLGALFTTVPAQQFNGQILSTKFTDQSGAEDVVINYVFDSGSTTEQYARGSLTEKITLINFATTDWERYSLQQNIQYDSGVISSAWVGGEIVVNGGFDTDTDWVKETGWTISGGAANCDGTQAGFTDLSQNILASGDTYLIPYKITSYTAGTLAITVPGANGVFNSAVGSYAEVLTTNLAGKLSATGDVNFIGSVDGISARKLLEIA